VLQCAAVCCSMLQHVAACRSHCVAVCCSVLQCVAVYSSVPCDVQRLSTSSDRVCGSVLQCVAVCCSVLQCGHYRVIARVSVMFNSGVAMRWLRLVGFLQL